MNNNLMIQDQFSYQLVELDKIQETCRKLLQTKHYQKLGEEGIHAIIARAKSLGIHPFEALNEGFYVVGGRVGMSTEMMAALVRKKGHSIQKDPKSNNEICILHGKRSDNGDTWTCSFSKQDAIDAGLWNQATWKKYPGIMLYNRCMSMLFRQLFPDLSLGAGYVEDELKEITKTGEYSEKQNNQRENMQEENKENVIDVNPLDIDKKPKTNPIISTAEMIELMEILEECDPEYKNHFLKKAMPANFKITALSDLPKKHFEKVKTAFMLKRDENWKMQEEEYKKANTVDVE